MNEKKHMKASELAAILLRKVEEVGDLEITVNTQEGASYSLYGEDDISVVPWKNKDGSEFRTIEIG